MRGNLQSTPDNQTELYIGLMSGTSLDGVDAVLARLPHPSLQTQTAYERPYVIARWHEPFEPQLRAQLLELHTPQSNELHQAALISNALADLYARAVHKLLQQTNYTSDAIIAIGAHGQTIRHQPDLQYTIQLNAPARLAELTQIDVIADFRSRDIAAGGQGAPLVPAFHSYLFGDQQTRVILNLGGIANVTILEPNAPVRGFDTGPANMLMDAWCALHTGEPFDRGGQWGAQGKVSESLLNALIASQPWLSLPPPKSTGRDLFNLNWLQQTLIPFQNQLSPQDVQATLQQLTAQTVFDALQQLNIQPPIQHVYGCGGGVHNTALMDRFKTLGIHVTPTDELGVASQDMEAMAFAWLAWSHHHRIAIALSDVTGAQGPRVPGARWPA
ncbi:anhydro-N-acetylmuramic acid kinase [Orrella sp. 11846]|uniref:anhydro-N-acetylmuramic acid kinase n=1 Tax=Orrella sp. 11846 TaxID=3409913 RepID=UPI003B58C98C